MATFFDGVTIGFWNSQSNNLYGKLVGNVSRSGNTVTLSGMVLNWWPRQTSYGTSDFTFYVNGVGTGARISPTGSMSLNNTSFGVSQSDTTRSVGWSSSDGKSGSFTVSFPSGYSGTISSPTIPVIKPTENSFTAEITCANLGGGSGNKEVSLEVWPTSTATSGQPHRFAQSFTTANSVTNKSLTVTNSSSAIAGGITMVANHAYWLVGYVNNSSASNNPKRGSSYKAYTLAKAPVVALDSVGYDRAVINWTAPADDGALSKTVEYSLDNASWETIDTISSGVTTAKSGTLTITGLDPSTNYTVFIRTTTTSGSNAAPELSITTQTLPLYGSVAGTVLTGTVDGTNLTSIDDSVFTRELLTYGTINLEDVDHATATYSGNYTLTVYDENNNVLATDQKNDPSELFGAWGLAYNLPFDGDGSITFTSATGDFTKSIKKLYGPGRYLDDIDPDIDTGETGATVSVADSSLLISKLLSYPAIETVSHDDTGVLGPIEITVEESGGDQVGRLDVRYSTSHSGGVRSFTNRTMAELTILLAEWGISFSIPSGNTGEISIDLGAIYTTESKIIQHLYGSVNGYTKRIF